MQADHYSSQRLMMRPFKQTDSDALTLGLQEPLVSCQLANVPDDYQPQHAQQFIAAFGTPDSQNFALAICLTKRPQMLIGGFGVRPLPIQASDFICQRLHVGEEDKPLLGLGYWIAHPHWGHGYASEMLNVMRPAVAKKFNRSVIGAIVLQHNIASLRVLAKSGFSNLGMIRLSESKHAGQMAHVLAWQSHY